ncbi:Beta-1,4-galactosyltransferase 1 [Characodon lateralis]|uniref:Beta-1,4-galactosyltransferase 1 n=1 Tax=Characodon lateralis TaxID=208331 RepID=A0ABU7EIQ5_9TELE|nr:Beta-1,4-galactosyltransferase 1 [Characodon lateralis]
MDGDQIFNRAKLLNVGYMEALKEYDYNCFVFSDVDLIPMDDRNTYRCFSQPRHLSVSMDKFGFSQTELRKTCWDWMKLF